MQNPISTDKLADLERRMAALGIAEADLLEKFVRGSGAGGQKINKTSNCVFLKHLPSGVCIKCQMDRSREMNRFLAKRELCEQLENIRDGKASAKTQAIEKMRRRAKRAARAGVVRAAKPHRTQVVPALRGFSALLRRCRVGAGLPATGADRNS